MGTSGQAREVYEETIRELVTRPERRMRRVQTGTLVHYEQTVRERVCSSLLTSFLRSRRKFAMCAARRSITQFRSCVG